MWDLMEKSAHVVKKAGDALGLGDKAATGGTADAGGADAKTTNGSSGGRLAEGEAASGRGAPLENANDSTKPGAKVSKVGGANDSGTSTQKASGNEPAAPTAEERAPSSTVSDETLTAAGETGAQPRVLGEDAPLNEAKEVASTKPAQDRTAPIEPASTNGKTSGGASPQANGAGGGSGQWKPAARYQGLGSGRAMRSYKRQMAALEGKWAALSVSERVQHMSDIVNPSLRKIGVHEVSVAQATLPITTNGQFDFVAWKVVVNENIVTAKTLTKKQFQGLVNTLYHEARHVEQWYQIAGYLAQHGMDQKGIFDLTGMPPAPILAAMANANKWSKQQMADAKAYCDSIYMHNAGYRDATLASQKVEAKTYSDLDQTLKKDAQTPTLTPVERQTKQQLREEAAQRLNALYEAYRRLPEEVDAFGVGNRAGKQSLTMKFVDYAGNLIELAKQWLASFRASGNSPSAQVDLVKALGYLNDAIIRIQQHLGTLGTSQFEQAVAQTLANRLHALTALQQTYASQIATQGTVVP
jgi:hypothetical protein